MINWIKSIFKSKKKIELNDQDGALILRGDGKMQIFIPKYGESSSKVELILSALYVNLADSKYTDKLVSKAFKKQEKEDEI